jgi:hypothetical protein
MSDDFSQWLSDLAEWDEDVARKIWEDYYVWMVNFSRRKLKGLGVSRGDCDEEDIASDAMWEFYDGMKNHKFPDLHSRDNLRQLLFTITDRKVTERKRYYFSQKQGGGQVRYESDIELSKDKDLQDEYARGRGLRAVVRFQVPFIIGYF